MFLRWTLSEEVERIFHSAVDAKAERSWYRNRDQGTCAISSSCQYREAFNMKRYFKIQRRGKTSWDGVREGRGPFVCS